jgi:hypothetical protein
VVCAEDILLHQDRLGAVFADGIELILQKSVAVNWELTVIGCKMYDTRLRGLHLRGGALGEFFGSFVYCTMGQRIQALANRCLGIIFPAVFPLLALITSIFVPAFKPAITLSLVLSYTPLISLPPPGLSNL